MPHNDPDVTDPMELRGVVIETPTDVNRQMAETFIEEYLRMGYDAARVMAMFKLPRYAGPFMAYQALGEPEIGRMIEETASLWGEARRGRPIRRDENGEVLPG